MKYCACFDGSFDLAHFHRVSSRTSARLWLPEHMVCVGKMNICLLCECLSYISHSHSHQTLVLPDLPYATSSAVLSSPFGVFILHNNSIV